MLYNVRHRDPEIGSIPPPERDPGIGSTPPPAKEQPPEPKPEPFNREEKPEPSPTPKEPEVDWTHAKVVFLIPKSIEATGFKGAIIGKAEEILSGITTRKIFDMTDGKVSPSWVFARIKPERYRSVSGLLGAESGVFVLVARQDVGFVKGLAVKRIESKLPDKLKRLPIEVIFERTQAELFVDIEAALKVREPQPKTKKPKELETSLFSDPINHIKGLLILSLTGQASQFGAAALAWWRRRKQRPETA